MLSPPLLHEFFAHRLDHGGDFTKLLNEREN